MDSACDLLHEVGERVHAASRVLVRGQHHVGLSLLLQHSDEVPLFAVPDLVGLVRLAEDRSLVGAQGPFPALGVQPFGHVEVYLGHLQGVHIAHGGLPEEYRVLCEVPLVGLVTPRGDLRLGVLQVEHVIVERVLVDHPVHSVREPVVRLEHEHALEGVVRAPEVDLDAYDVALQGGSRPEYDRPADLLPDHAGAVASAVGVQRLDPECAVAGYSGLVGRGRNLQEGEPGRHGRGPRSLRQAEQARPLGRVALLPDLGVEYHSRVGWLFPGGAACVLR